MPTPPANPPDEARRLARLRGLLVMDSPPEPLLDHLVQWAAEVCGAPIALLGLIDEHRQWYKARHGMDATQTPRDQTFCAHAILGDALLEVPDAAADQRFADNPMVRGEPHIRFYAGMPLALAGGERIGTLCVVDHRPRTLTPEQAQTLRRLATLATEAIEMRGALLQRALVARSEQEQALAASEAQHRAIVEAQSELISLARADGTLTYVNPAYARAFGRTPAEIVGRSLFDFVEAADRALVGDRLRWVLACGESIVGENRMDAPGGDEVWVHWTNSLQAGPGGQRLVRSVGRDISARKRAEAALRASENFLRQITDNLDLRIAYVDRELRYRFVNQAHCERFGLPREQILGRTRAELLGKADPAEILDHGAAVLRGEPQRFEIEQQAGSGWQRIESRLFPDLEPDGTVRGFFAVGIDITDRHRDEQALRVLTTLLERSTDFILQSSPKGELLYMNPAARALVGLAPDAPLAGHDVLEFNTEASNRLIRQELLPAVKRDGVWRGETEVRTGDGRVLPVSHLSIAHHDADGRLLRYSSVLRDISGEVEARAEVARQGAMLRSVTESLPVIVSAVDSELRYRFVNSAFEQWHGVERDGVLGRSALQLLSPHELATGLPWAERALAGETVQFERHYPDRPGQPTLSLTYIPIRLEDGRSDGFVGVGLDITPHRQEQVRLRSLAERDALTGLLNRAGFQAALAAALADGLGPGLALLYIDLDHFKPVNDLHGHATGDAVLVAFAQRLSRLVRPSDVTARLGGDEFAVLLAGVRSPQAAEAVAAKIVAAAAEPVSVLGLRLQIGASVGLAVGAEPGGDGSDLVQRADEQLYRAKAAGRGRHAG